MPEPERPTRPPAPGDRPPFDPEAQDPFLAPVGPEQTPPPNPPVAAAPVEPVSPVPSPAPGPRSRRPVLRGIGGLLAPVLVLLGLFGGVTLDRAGLLPGSPAAPGSTPPAAAPATADPDASPGPTLAPGETPEPTLPPGVTGLDLIEEAWKTIHDNYVDAANLDDRAMAYAAIRAMTEAVKDEGHTAFLTPEELKAVEDSLSGEFVGIGVEIDTSDGIFRIADVIPGAPAEEAGLKRGDVIVAADGKRLDGLSEDEAFARIRGPEGEAVVLTLRRDGSEFERRIVRRQFDLQLVSWAMVPGTKVAFVRLESFSSGAGDAVKKALEEARAAGATSLLFDLRGNPGGYVSEAVHVASQFLDDGVVFVTRDRAGKEEPSLVEPDGAWTDLPMAVLVDGNTASSAEIVSSAIQDAGRGRIIGEQTFGTGTVLARFDLVDGSSLRIGTVLWLTRNGKPLWNEGLIPDIKVELGPDEPRLRPRDIEDLAPAEVDQAQDTQVVRGVRELRQAP